jgi:phage baseplate assembly protein W
MAIKSKTFIDFDASFEPNPVTGDLMTRADDKAIKFALRSLIMTNYYERPFQSKLGSPVNRLLFEQMGPNFDHILKQSIIDVINNYEPRVDVLDVEVSYTQEKNSVFINIIYKIKNTETELTLGLTLKRTR